MSTVTPEQQAEIDRRVAAALAAGQQQQPQQPMQQGWQPPQQQFQQFPMQPAGQMQMPAAQPTGVLVPVELTGPDGRQVTVQLMFPAQFAANPQALMGLITSLMQQGIPVRAFAPKQQGGWGGNGGGRNYGGYNRGGYGNGGGGGWR